MFLRKSPVKKINQVVSECRQAGLDVTPLEVEQYSLCGGDPLELGEALLKAKEVNVPVTIDQLTSVFVVGHDPIDSVVEAARERELVIDTFSADGEDQIRGFTQSEEEVYASARIFYWQEIYDIVTPEVETIYERLGAAISVFINTAESLRSLQIQRPEHEAELITIAKNRFPRIKSVVVEYFKNGEQGGASNSSPRL